MGPAWSRRAWAEREAAGTSAARSQSRQRMGRMPNLNASRPGASDLTGEGRPRPRQCYFTGGPR
jgi:hypothetical protein